MKMKLIAALIFFFFNEVLLVSEDKLVLEQKALQLVMVQYGGTGYGGNIQLHGSCWVSVQSPDCCYHLSAIYIIIFKASTPIYKP